MYVCMYIYIYIYIYICLVRERASFATEHAGILYHIILFAFYYYWVGFELFTKSWKLFTSFDCRILINLILIITTSFNYFNDFNNNNSFF